MGIKEEVYYEGGPHVGDLIFNILLAFTVICIPLTVGQLFGRCGCAIALQIVVFA